MRQILAIASIILLCTAAWANEGPKDPFRSPMWETMRDIVFDGQDVVFDERVTVLAPASAEDSTRVPVAVRVEGLQDVEEIIIFVDLNPFPQALHMHLDNAKPYVETRIRLNEASPIRAAAKTPDAVWHVSGTYVDAAGGGCTAPRSTQVGPGWEDHLNEVQARV